MPEQNDSERERTLLEQARTRYSLVVEAERKIRDEAREDLRFLAGEQWDMATLHERKSNGRPALTINKLPVFVRQVSNEARQNSASVKINAVGQEDYDTAQVMQGLIRHIEYSSNADVIYQTALDQAVSCGFGVFRITTDYCDDSTFDQEIKVEAVPDQFSVWFDCYAKEFDRSDSDWAFVTKRYSKDEFKRRWPNAEATSVNLDQEHPACREGWIKDDSVLVAEYWYVKIRKRRLIYLQTGEMGFEDEFTVKPAPGEIVRVREVDERHVRCATLNGVEVLEDQEWPGKWIPLVPVYGAEMIIDNERRLFSLIRFARDPQSLYNYYKTAQAEAIALSPKAPYIAAEGQIEGHEDHWKLANIKNYAVLTYKPKEIGGTIVPPPQRNQYEPPIQALSLGAMQASDDMKATMGIYDAGLGARSNETSGIAIMKRQNESDTANYHFIDNLTRAQRQAGRIMLDLVPKIYDTERQVNIVGEDDRAKVVKVNAQQIDAYGNPAGVKNDFNHGKYDATVTTGPSYTTKRAEAFTVLTNLAQAYPQLMQIAGDLIMRNADVPGGDQIANRMAKTMPPELVADTGDKVPPAALSKINQLQQQNTLLVQELQKATADIEKQQRDNESKERIAAMNNRTDLIIAQAKLNSQEAVELLNAELAAVNRRLDLLKDEEPVTGAPAGVQ